MKIANALKMESNLVPILPDKKPATILGGYYIKARCIQNSAIASAPPHVREIWDWLIKEAEYKPKQLKGTSLSRGQLFTDYAEIQEGLSWKEGFIKKSYQKHHVDYAMRWLREKEMITTQKTTRGIIITVCNYELYQNPDNYKKDADYDTDTLTIGQATPQTPVITTDETIVTTLKPILSEEKKGDDYDSAKDTANDTASETIAKEVNNSNTLDSNSTTEDLSLVPNGTTEPVRDLAELEWKKVYENIKNSEDGLKNFILTHRPKFIHPYGKYWNIVAANYGWPKVKELNQGRRNKLKTRIAESAFQFTEIIDQAKNSDFIGRNGRCWFSFDWILENSNNYVKVLEGNYLKVQAPPTQQQSINKKQKSTSDVLKEVQELQQRNAAKYGR